MSNNQPALAPALDRAAILDECMPMLQRIALRWSRISSQFDADELLSVAVLRVLEKLEQLPAGFEEPGRYLVKCASFAVLDAVSHGHKLDDQVSLDAPLYDDGKTTRLDRIASPEPTTPQDRDFSTLYAAIAQLTDDQQCELKRFYGLADLDLPKQRGHRRTPSVRAKESLRYRAVRNLRMLLASREAVCA